MTDVKGPINWYPQAFTLSASFIIQERYACILCWITNEWSWCPAVHLLVMKLSKPSPWVWNLSFLLHHQVLLHCFPWLSGMCITALHLSHFAFYIFLSPLVISISGMCLMVWDSLVNRSHDKQPISAQSLDYDFREQRFSVQQYVISACAELHWRLGAFNNNSIKNDAGHSAEGRAAKSQLKRIQIRPVLACLLIRKTLLCLVIEFYDYT